ncbi:MAG: TdeIII family type II restriction endonuclease, partial [Chloroflexota bacterium]
MENLNPSLEEAVKEFVEDAVGTYLDKKLDNLRKGKETTREHVLLDRLFPVERRIRSIIGGLETSLGTKFWEKLARYVAKSSDFELREPNEFLKPISMPDNINKLIQDWRAKRLVPNSQIGTQKYVSELRNISQNVDKPNIEFTSISGGDGIDLWLVKDGKEYIFDLKTVQVNAGNG